MFAKFGLLKTNLLSASLLLLAACTSVTPVIPLATEAQDAVIAPASTVVSAGSGEVITIITSIPDSGNPIATSTPEPTIAGEGLVVTTQNQGQTLHLKVGQTFLLKLGMDIYNWEVAIDNQAVVSRVIGITVVRGAQGVYQAKAPGTTRLTATGDPLCRQAEPKCMMPSMLFEVTIVVD